MARHTDSDDFATATMLLHDAMDGAFAHCIPHDGRGGGFGVLMWWISVLFLTVGWIFQGFIFAHVSTKRGDWSSSLPELSIRCTRCSGGCLVEGDVPVGIDHRGTDVYRDIALLGRYYPRA